MAKRMTDDEVMDYTYNKLFGDLDEIEAGQMFGEDEDENELEGAAPNAESAGVSGIELTIKPLMVGAREGGRDPEDDGQDRGSTIDEVEAEEAKKGRLKGIGKMSPLMARLHGEE